MNENIEKFIPKEYIDTILLRDETTGILTADSLLLRACKSGNFGSVIKYDGGYIYDANFTFLDGKPNKSFFEKNIDLFLGKFLVCKTSEWENFILSSNLDILRMTRFMMKKQNEFLFDDIKIKGDYRLSEFKKQEFDLKPFNHGANYIDFDDFNKNGVGAVAYYKDFIVSSASSFISFNNEVEVDISTDQNHRNKGLAINCAKAMLNECSKRRIKAHWDAQNNGSKVLAERLGFEVEQEYAVTMLLNF